MSNILLPTQWNANDKCKYLVVDDTKLRVSYKGMGKLDTDAGAIRADRAIPPSAGLFYFEIFITNKGRDGHIGIGLSAPTTSLSRLPGWDEHTYGYHADDGNIFKGSGGIEYGPTFTTGDIIGCCVNFRTNTVFYTKNGLRLGTAFQGILNEPLHPSVGLRTPGEVIEANFGQKPFKFDFLKLQREEKQAIVMEAMKTPTRGLESETPNMVLQYLIHYGYSKTAKSFSNSILHKPDEKSFSSINERQQIFQDLIKGNIDQAMIKIKQHYPECLRVRSDIKFQLKYHRFIQMIISDSPEKAILYGRKSFSFEDPQVIENQDLLEDVFSLLAYTNPSESPVSYLFSESFREQLANSVNSAILESLGLPKVSSLERCFSHLETLISTMKAHNITGALLAEGLSSPDPVSPQPSPPSPNIVLATSLNVTVPELPPSPIVEMDLSS